MEAMVAAGNHPRRLLAADVVKTYRAIVAHHQILAGDRRELLELRGGEALLFRPFHHLLAALGGRAAVLVSGGVPEQADVDQEHGAHASAGEKQSEKHGEKHSYSH